MIDNERASSIYEKPRAGYELFDAVRTRHLTVFTTAPVQVPATWLYFLVITCTGDVEVVVAFLGNDIPKY